MERIIDFINDCDAFFVSTVFDGKPQTRPFGAMMQLGNLLYITTGKNRNVYNQFLQNSNIQIVAKKPDSRVWLRISGQVKEVLDLELKEKMLQSCPKLVTRYSTADSPKFALFVIENMVATKNSDSGKEEIFE